MKRTKSGSTPKQYAYAMRRLSGQGKSKKEMALLSGFSPSVAENVKHKVEETEGYQNALIVLGHESNNLLLAAFAEFKARGLTNFSNADLTKALNAITGAWDRIESKRAPDKLKTPEGNRLRAVFTERTRTAVVESVPTEAPADAPSPAVQDAEFHEKQPDPAMDF